VRRWADRNRRAYWTVARPPGSLDLDADRFEGLPT